MTALRNIYFDVGNTLLFPDRDLILEPLRQRNVWPSLELWHSVERVSKPEFDEVLEHGRADVGFWQIFYTHLLEELNLEDAALHAELVARTRLSKNWGNLRPGTRDLLCRIAQTYRIAVISNADGKILELLQGCGIADCFQSITDSGLVGHEKPSAAIFEIALSQMQARPEESLYVGDVYSVDYLGARRCGMQAVLFDVCGAYRRRDLPRVESLEQLEEKLETRHRDSMPFT
jgi:putative hydrolase of the HAD superfamily